MSEQPSTLDNIRAVVGVVRELDQTAGDRRKDLRQLFEDREAHRLNRFRYRKLDASQREAHISGAWEDAGSSQPILKMGRAEVLHRRELPAPEVDNGARYFDLVAQAVDALENLGLQELGVVEQTINRRALGITINGEQGVFRSAADVGDWLILHGAEATVRDLDGIRTWARSTASDLDGFVRQPETLEEAPYTGPGALLLYYDDDRPIDPAAARSVATLAQQAVVDASAAMAALGRLHEGAIAVEYQAFRTAGAAARDGSPMNFINHRRAHRDLEDARRRTWHAPVTTLARRAADLPEAGDEMEKALQRMVEATKRVGDALDTLREEGVEWDGEVMSAPFARVEYAADCPGGYVTATAEDISLLNNWVVDAADKLDDFCREHAAEVDNDLRGAVEHAEPVRDFLT